MTGRKLAAVRVYFVDDDPAALWEKGQTADDLGPETPGSNVHLLRLDHFEDSLVCIEDPYGRGLIRRLQDSGEGERSSENEVATPPPGFSDAELDEYLDSREQDE